MAAESGFAALGEIEYVQAAPACVTVNDWPPMVSVAVRELVLVLAVADQLTAPSMMLEIARNNLRAIQTWLPESGRGAALSPRVTRRRLSESFAWVGEAELEGGHRMMAVRRLANSLAVMPGLD